MYDDLLSAPTQATSSRRSHSWSSMDNDTYATWSTAQDYTMPNAMTGLELYHPTALMPQFTIQPPILGSNDPLTSVPTHWAAPAMQSSLPVHTRSPMRSNNIQSASFYGYDDYQSIQQPMAAYDPTYTASMAQGNYAMMPHHSATGMPRSSAATGQQHYPTYSTSPTYHDPRYPQNPSHQY